jgi:hypothetical protein
MYAWKANKYTNYSFSLLIMYGSSNMFQYYIAIFRERSQITTHHATRHNTSNHNILSTAPQLNISWKAIGLLPEDGNVMPKHVGATIHK